MKRVRLLLLPLPLLLLSGCIGMTTKYAELEPQLVQWDKEREYGRSLDALGQVDPMDPDYAKAAKLRKQVEKRAADYEQQVRKETAQKLKNGDWAAALDQFDEALAKYPQSVVLKDGLAKLHQQQREDLDELELKQLVLHGEWLRDALPIHRDITRIAPRSREAQSRLKRVEDEAREIAQQLAIIGNTALADGDLDTADATLPLAQKLSNDPMIEGSLKRLQEELKLEEQKQLATRRHNQERARQTREKKEHAIKAIVARYDKAFAKQDYLTARVQLEEIEKIDKRYAALPSMQQSLQQAIDDKVARLFDAGVSAYSRGQFEQAASEWRKVLQLDPDHQQASENLERADKILQKIEKLKQKQGS